MKQSVKCLHEGINVKSWIMEKSTHIMTRPAVERRTPHHVSSEWIGSRYLKRLNREGVLLLRGLDIRLSKDLPSDLQKLRLPSLSHEFDQMVSDERKRRPELLTARSNMSYYDRRLAGLCPLNSQEMTWLLKALGAANCTRIYWAGGQPLGGKQALRPLMDQFPYFYNKEDLALPGELEPYPGRASFMAAVDHIVSERSDVFMASHGGNMGHAIQGQRAYAGHKKFITPKKRHMIPYFVNSSETVQEESEFNRIIKELHRDSLGLPEVGTSKAGRDVTKYPVPECMCNERLTAWPLVKYASGGGKGNDF